MLVSQRCSQGIGVPRCKHDSDASDASDALRMSPSDAQTKDYNFLPCTSIRALLFEELASLTNHCFKGQLRDPLEPFFVSTMPKHDRPLYLLAAFLKWLMFGS